MPIDNLTSLTPNKQNHPEVIPPNDPVYYLSAAEYNKLLSTLQTLIDDYNLNVSALGEGISLPLITSGDSLTEPTDSNIFSAARVLQEIRDVLLGYDDYYLSKRLPDTAEGKIRFNKGIQLGDYQSGFRGGIINENADAELQSLTLRDWLQVPELRFNRIEVYMGDKWRSPGGGIIESVDIQNQIITLKLEPGEYGAVAVGDLCMGIFHSVIDSNNATSDLDDSRNNRAIKGFATSYFKVEELLNPSENNSRFRYSLRPISSRYTRQIQPEPFMHFAAFGNTIDTSRQSSAYETRTYQRFLINMNDWESTQLNVAAQFGDLSNLNALGLTGLTGYSVYLNNVYFTGTIQQMKAPKIMYGTWWTWNGTEWVDSGVPAVIQPQDGIYATLINESLAIGRTDTNFLHTWAELHVYEGNTELVYNKTSATTRGTYTVSVVPTNVTVGDLVQTTLNGKTFLKTTPITGINAEVNSGNILFNITGIRLDGTTFSFSKNQTFVKVDSGVDGESSEYVFTRTTTDAAPLKPDSQNTDGYIPNGWTADPVGPDSEYKFEWVCKRQKVNSIWSAWSNPAHWSMYAANGINGKDGKSIEYIYTRNNNSQFGVDSNIPPTSQTDDYVPPGWTDEPQGVNSDAIYEWVSSRTKSGGIGGVGGTWSPFSRPALWAKFSFDGLPGTKGNDAINVILSNETHIFPAINGAAINGSTSASVLAYKGTTQVTPTSITVGTMPTGMTASVNNSVITFSVTTSMVSSSGMVTITIVVEGQSIIKQFSYSLSSNGKTISLTGSTQVIKVTASGREPNTNFNIVGTPVNTTITAWTYSTNGGSFSTTVPAGLSRSGNTVTVNPLNVTASTISIKASDGEISDVFTIALVYDGAQGPPGTGVPIVYRGNYSDSAIYYGSTTRLDIVKFQEVYYRTTDTAGQFTGIQPVPGQDTDHWLRFGESFEAIATGLLLAEKANIASFAFVDQKMISQNGIDANGNAVSLGSDNTPPSGYIPNLLIDGVNGVISASANKVRFNADGSGYLADNKIHWEADGSGYIANNGIHWDTAGNLTVNGQLFTGTPVGGIYPNEIRSDGSGRLANGNITWDTAGNTIFRGKFESNTYNNRIIINDSSRDMYGLDSAGNLMFKMGFDDLGDTVWNNSSVFELYTRSNAPATTYLKLKYDYGKLDFNLVNTTADDASSSVGLFKIYIDRYIAESSKTIRAEFSTIGYSSNPDVLYIRFQGLPNSADIIGQVYVDSNGYLRMKL